jgi:probable FeS assembly SUF system protein SufT
MKQGAADVVKASQSILNFLARNLNVRNQDITIVRREVTGLLIPHGEAIQLLPGTEVLVTQELGGSFTLNVNGNLVRIDGKDAPAIGKEIPVMPIDQHLNSCTDIDEKILWDQLKTCYDPEIPVNIVDLGLIYSLTMTRQESGGYHVGVQMTLTAPGCGMGPVLTKDVEDKIRAVPWVDAVDVVLIFDPPWHSDLMSEAAKLQLGML